ncbi:MAG: hypothetical protein ACK58N_06870 [Synechocystis sp.]
MSAIVAIIRVSADSMLPMMALEDGTRPVADLWVIAVLNSIPSPQNAKIEDRIEKTDP